MTNIKHSITVLFDFAQMAREAQREQDKLREILRIRKEAGPETPDQELIWKRENSILYHMYLEQRANAISFRKRAERRGQYD